MGALARYPKLLAAKNGGHFNHNSSPELALVTIDHMTPDAAARWEWAKDCLYLHRGSNMPLVNIVIMLIVVGVVLSLINRYIPMASSIKSILNVVVVVVVLVWVLQAAGLWGGISQYRLGR